MINHPFWDTTIFGNSHFFFSSALQTARQVAGNLSFYDLDLDLGDLGGEITWSVPQELGDFFWEILNLSDVEVDFFFLVGNLGRCGGFD